MAEEEEVLGAPPGAVGVGVGEEEEEEEEGAAADGLAAGAGGGGGGATPVWVESFRQQIRDGDEWLMASGRDVDFFPATVARTLIQDLDDAGEVVNDLFSVTSPLPDDAEMARQYLEALFRNRRNLCMLNLTLPKCPQNIEGVAHAIGSPLATCQGDFLKVGLRIYFEEEAPTVGRGRNGVGNRLIHRDPAVLNFITDLATEIGAGATRCESSTLSLELQFEVECPPAEMKAWMVRVLLGLSSGVASSYRQGSTQLRDIALQLVFSKEPRITQLRFPVRDDFHGPGLLGRGDDFYGPGLLGRDENVIKAMLEANYMRHWGVELGRLGRNVTAVSLLDSPRPITHFTFPIEEVIRRGARSRIENLATPLLGHDHDGRVRYLQGIGTFPSLQELTVELEPDDGLNALKAVVADFRFPRLQLKFAPRIRNADHEWEWHSEDLGAEALGAAVSRSNLEIVELCNSFASAKHAWSFVLAFFLGFDVANETFSRLTITLPLNGSPQSEQKVADFSPLHIQPLLFGNNQLTEELLVCYSRFKTDPAPADMENSALSNLYRYVHGLEGSCTEMLGGFDGVGNLSVEQRMETYRNELDRERWKNKVLQLKNEILQLKCAENAGHKRKLEPGAVSTLVASCRRRMG